MSSVPYMHLYVGDYLSDTLHLTTEQHGAYLLLLMTMWRHGASLPNDPAKLARVCRVTPKRWAAVWSEIAGFFEVDGDQITNARLTKEHQKAVSISQERKTAGRKGAEAKALKYNNAPQANAEAELKHSHNHNQNHKEEDTPDGVSKSEKAPSVRKKRGTSMTQDWALSKAGEAYAVKAGLSVAEARERSLEFRDYWLGRGTVNVDWEAVWRNRVRTIIEYKKTRPATASRVSGFISPEDAAVQKRLDRVLADAAARRSLEGRRDNDADHDQGGPGYD
jgi:uncharacterized protein YdaU (DUF1376 family)